MANLMDYDNNKLDKHFLSNKNCADMGQLANEELKDLVNIRNWIIKFNGFIEQNEVESTIQLRRKMDMLLSEE